MKKNNEKVGFITFYKAYKVGESIQSKVPCPIPQGFCLSRPFIVFVFSSILLHLLI
jgi:hypothetical protein